MTDPVQQAILKTKIFKLKMNGASRKEVMETTGISSAAVTKYTKMLQPQIEKIANELMDCFIKQKVELSKKRYEIFKKVLSLPINDENFYRQLRAAQESAKEENEALLVMHKLRGSETTEVREDVWGAVLKHIGEQKREFGIGEDEREQIDSSEDEGESGSEQIEVAGNEGESCEGTQQ